MSVFDFIARFIIVVIPGIIAVSLFSYLADKKASSELLSVVYFFIASIISFLTGNIVLWVLNLLPCFNFVLVDISQIMLGESNDLSTAGLTAAIIMSVVWGFVATAIWDSNLFFKIAAVFNLTHKADNDLVWDTMFDDQPWIIFRDYVTGNTYYGMVARYSEGEKTREILLTDVSVWGDRDGDYKMEHIYLSRNPSEFSIEIDNYKKET